MKEKFITYKNRIEKFWGNTSKSQKGMVIGVTSFLTLILITVSIFSSNTKMIPLYKDLTLQEMGQIKTELDTRGIPCELEQGGTTILVPDNQAETLLVDLAASGLPNSGTI
ncbi:hypothetical protein [Halobacillus mangrovi]|uniref:Flagellar M-ring N-terminal domain-containing protein n=1 Tax=Halobacillus mangrovi TaxID=402384 RepID=A0A1W5ZW15_9BACI|nr:hypothetical protein [Halobacillus mangrovi]ARI77485.1 hypothetical protein HM131_11795 [Halobacillus mangrovi]